MSLQPRIEEISDSDSDPPEEDLSTYAEDEEILQKATISSLRHHNLQPVPSDPQKSLKTHPPPDYKGFLCLYPVYFDAARSRAEGRRVKKDQAVHNPLAREIVDAVQLLGLNTVFEPGKMHPKDWANPGRVRVQPLRGEVSTSGFVKNKHHLYILVSKYLRAHPTTNMTPLRLQIQGLPPQNGPAPTPAVPRGWKMGSILPLHSPALTGGGVSENILKDIMDEAQMRAPGEPTPMQGILEPATGSSKKKKDSKRK